MVSWIQALITLIQKKYVDFSCVSQAEADFSFQVPTPTSHLTDREPTEEGRADTWSCQSRGSAPFCEVGSYNLFIFRLKKTSKRGAFLFRKNDKSMWKYIQNTQINQDPKAALCGLRERHGGGTQQGEHSGGCSPLPLWRSAHKDSRSAEAATRPTVRAAAHALRKRRKLRLLSFFMLPPPTVHIKH